MKVRRVAAILAIGYGLGCVAAGVLLAEFSVRLHKQAPTGEARFRATVQREFGASVDDVELAAADGAVLRAWFVQPQRSNGEAVVLLHGIAGNREGIAGFGDIFLRQGYSVLTPDSRDHGESGGRITTYGVLERDDVRRWVEWVRGRAPGCTYLLGESMGAAIGLQATAVTPQLCAVVVEDPYSEFREISYERLGRQTGLGTLFWKTVGRPVIEFAFAYTQVRYGVSLPDAEPRAAVMSSRVPALLIAGSVDEDIPMHHAEELEKVCGARCELWVVPGADHGGASSVEPTEFDQRVVRWFAVHDSAH